MNSFNKFVIGIAIIILILSLITFGFIIKYEPKKTVSRVVQNTCPDGWDIDDNNMCVVPSSYVWDGSLNGVLKTTSECIGATCKTSLDLTKGNPDWNKYYPADSFICARSKWANKNGLTWEGITNLGSSACT